MAVQQVDVGPGDDLYRIAARFYGDADGWTIIARANGLSDPLIQTLATLLIPTYSKQAANFGIYAPAA